MNYTEGMLREGSLKGKNILITGGGTGLGRAMGEYFLELGANLVITSRKLEVLEETAKEMMAKSGGKVIPIVCDVREIEQVEAMWAKCIAAFGQIHGVLNNAAGNFISPTERLSANAFNTVLDIVLKGTSQVTLTAGKHWIAEKQPGVFLRSCKGRCLGTYPFPRCRVGQVRHSIQCNCTRTIPYRRSLE